MGLFKKIFKPVSKVLDKIIPNEIKPALPYLAAFAPMFGPTSAMMGQGIMKRALISGGLNIGAIITKIIRQRKYGFHFAATKPTFWWLGVIGRLAIKEKHNSGQEFHVQTHW